jgi:hypothetical protein
VATRIDFWGPEAANRGLGLPGTVVGVDADGKGFALRWTEQRPPQNYRLNEKSVFVFSAVAAGEAKLAVEMQGLVFDDEDARVAGNPIAGYVQLFGNAWSKRDTEPNLTGKLLAADDKTLTIEVPPAVPGGEPKKVVLKLGAKCLTIYHNVGVGGAKPVAGQAVKVWLETNSKDTAAEVALTGVPPERWAVIEGMVVGVSEDGATITVEQAAAVRGEEPKRVEIKLARQTRIAYAKIGPDGAKPTVGYAVQVRLLDGSKDTASHAGFTKGTGER